MGNTGTLQRPVSQANQELANEVSALLNQHAQIKLQKGHKFFFSSLLNLMWCIMGNEQHIPYRPASQASQQLANEISALEKVLQRTQRCKNDLPSHAYNKSVGLLSPCGEPVLRTFQHSGFCGCQHEHYAREECVFSGAVCFSLRVGGSVWAEQMAQTLTAVSLQGDPLLFPLFFPSLLFLFPFISFFSFSPQNVFFPVFCLSCRSLASPRALIAKDMLH